MIQMKIEMQDDLLNELTARLTIVKSLPATQWALDEAAKFIRQCWQGYLIGKRDLGIEPMKPPSGRLVNTIKIATPGRLRRVVYSESEGMKRLITGTPEIDMKETHTRGPRSRVSMKGVPYVIIPLRWGTPPKKGEQRVGFGKNVMPVDVYKIVENKMTFRPTITTVGADKSDYKTPNARGEMVGRAQYSDVLREKAWGDRLSSEQLGMEGSNMEGMSNMLGDDGKTAGYFTFRIISREKPEDWGRRPHKKSWEESWRKPATHGRPITQGVVNATQDDVNKLLEMAVRKDLGL
jgi:hypothetical protein